MPNESDSDQVESGNPKDHKRGDSASGKKQEGQVKNARPKKNQTNSAKRRPLKWWAKTFDTKTIVAWAAIAAVPISILAIYFNDRQHRQDHRPRVVFSRPIELLEPLTCDMEKGEAHTGKMRVWLQNLGNVDAKRVFVASGFKFISQRKSGNPTVDDPPSITDSNCEHEALPTRETFSLPVMAPGREFAFAIKQSAMAFSPAPGKDAFVQLYFYECAHYSDERDTHHGTCDVYRLLLPDGETTFQCNKPISGNFQLHMTGHCAN